jgi:hypothetical protein
LLQNDPLRLPPFHFDADPDPACHFDADLDPASQNDADPRGSGSAALVKTISLVYAGRGDCGPYAEAAERDQVSQHQLCHS